jgi:hypothetical protein
MRCETRTLDDIRALGGNDAADERCFAAADRVSQANLALYRTFVQPFVRAAVNPAAAEWMRKLHPLRLQYEIFSNANPAMATVAGLAEQVRHRRQPAAADNPFLALQDNVSRSIVAVLDAWRDVTEAFAEQAFFAVYGSPAVQAAVGINPAAAQPARHAAKSQLHQELMQTRIAEIKKRIPLGGLREALIRGLLFVGMGRSGVDERAFETVRRIRETESDVPLAAFKAMVREQFYMLLLDADAALAAIPSMLPGDQQSRLRAFDFIKQVLSARGPFSQEDRERLQQIARLFGAGERLSDEGAPARRGDMRRVS